MLMLNEARTNIKRKYIVNYVYSQCTVYLLFLNLPVLPLFKKRARNYGNYRSVSILPVISKVLQRVVHKQFYAYLDENDRNYKFQPGFRSSYSTDSTLTYLCDKITFNMDNGLYIGLVLLDLLISLDLISITL